MTTPASDLKPMTDPEVAQLKAAWAGGEYPFILRLVARIEADAATIERLEKAVVSINWAGRGDLCHDECMHGKGLCQYELLCQLRTEQVAALKEQAT
jgi:hypothetical protein